MSEEMNNYYEQPTNNQGGKGLAIASMVVGIVSIVLSCIWYISVPCGIVAIVLSVIYNKNNEKCGMSKAGLICGIIGIILTIVWIVLVAVIGVAALGMVGAAGLSGM